MQKIIRIQSIQQQDATRRQELATHTPSQRMNMLFALINQSAKNSRLERIAHIRHVPFR